MKEFVDEENNFKVKFPGTPSKDVYFGKVNVVTYKVARKGSNSSVSVMTFPVDVSAKADELLESYKSELPNLTASAPSRFPKKVGNTTFDREVQFGRIKAREFGYESDYYFTQVAVFVLGNKLYEIKTDVTNWHILTKHYPEIVEAFYSEATRFRNSFSLLK